MDIPRALQWWEGSQLRVLGLASLIIQYILMIISPMRKFPVPSMLRLLLWLAYLSGDFVAIYGLATLFNLPVRLGETNGLEMLWAPIFLIHLGGQDGITAYNIEDNELWTRHILTGVKQIAVCVYVFWKLWPGGNNRLRVQSILVLVSGALKCMEKPWTLYSASINSLVTIDCRTAISSGSVSLAEFVRKAREIVAGRPSGTPDKEDIFDPSMLFVDHASPLGDRLRTMKSFLALSDADAYRKLREGFHTTFDRLYTKKKFIVMYFLQREKCSLRGIVGLLVRLLGVWLPVMALVHFNRSQIGHKDYKFTKILLFFTALLDGLPYLGELILTRCIRIMPTCVQSWMDRSIDDSVSQYNLIGDRGRITNKLFIKSRPSSRSITVSVLEHVKQCWTAGITDASSYRRISDSWGHLSIKHLQCHVQLHRILDGPFDEAVLLWHLATDFCYYYKGASDDARQAAARCLENRYGYERLSGRHKIATLWRRAMDGSRHGPACPVWCGQSLHHVTAVRCREMSNYMMYLLFVNPEMLMAGSRRNLVSAVHDELKRKKIAGNKLWLNERQVTQEIVDTVEDGGSLGISFVDDAWATAKVLLALPDEKMWTVIEGVWVEMLCFSAARCRGYLHAKSLGTGVEYLSYVWLLLYYMGMETLSERLQRTYQEDQPATGQQRTDHENRGQTSAQDIGETRTSPLPPRYTGLQRRHSTGNPSASHVIVTIDKEAAAGPSTYNDINAIREDGR